MQGWVYEKEGRSSSPPHDRDGPESARGGTETEIRETGSDPEYCDAQLEGFCIIFKNSSLFSLLDSLSMSSSIASTTDI